MRYKVIHRTEYEYSDPVSCSHNEARLLPRLTSSQLCRDARLKIEPEPADYHERQDFFGNRVAYFSIREPHQRFSVIAS
ncbi:MAG TPA: transglutaminase N-terminal domain-containing protein, partial [Burkholderiales bacterium]|nr:transglutaminase N-terminal domain-containing protein [Burkholderiales bacterium]